MKLLTIQDISCYGQCSTTVALPILSSFGIETVILPSSVLSTHTSGFKNFTVHDLTLEMDKIINHWKNESIKFDALYTGYIGDKRQFDYVLKIRDEMLNDNSIVFIDPAMADNGKLYPGLDMSIVEGMKKICFRADYLIPNITEACLLTDTEYKENFNEDEIKLILARLMNFGCKCAIITGVNKDNTLINYAYYKYDLVKVVRNKEIPSYHGTGDIFSSIFIANILNNKSIKESLEYASDFIIDCIKETREDKSHSYGVKFEKVLYKLIK